MLVELTWTLPIRIMWFSNAVNAVYVAEIQKKKNDISYFWNKKQT